MGFRLWVGFPVLGLWFRGSGLVQSLRLSRNAISITS
jgi:hypothetical protein